MTVSEKEGVEALIKIIVDRGYALGISKRDRVYHVRLVRDGEVLECNEKDFLPAIQKAVDRVKKK